MPNNLNKVRVKEIAPSNRNKTYLIIALSVLLLIAVIATISLSTFADKLPFQSTSPEIINDGKRNIIKVPSGGDLQKAINQANGGDIIELQAGGVYYGEIRLPNKNISDFITIQSSGINNLPANKIVNPSQSSLLAKIVTRGKGVPAISTENKAHHYKFIGIEFTANNSDYIYNLVYLGSSDEKGDITQIPHHIEFDRCYFHPKQGGVTRRGIAVNSADVVIKYSYFEGFAFPQEETQAICGWTGTKNVLITNNYIEGGAENIMFGGADPARADLIPSDIVVTYNVLSKPESWKNKNSIKCLFELKNAKRVQFVGNYLENNWADAAIRITVRNQDGTSPFSTIEDVLIQDNIINGSGAGINILGKDDTHPSQKLKNLTITNNLLLNIGKDKFEGGGYFIMVSNGENINISNNTSFNYGNLTTFHGDLPQKFIVRDNIIGHGNYGIHGHPNINSSEGQRFFTNNVIFNGNGISSDDTSFPKGNFWQSDVQSIGFNNLNSKDFRLRQDSKFKGRGLNKSDLGCDINRLTMLNYFRSR